MEIRLILSGWFQCSPDNFDKYLKTVIIESNELYKLIDKGYQVIGSEIVEKNINSKNEFE